MAQHGLEKVHWRKHWQWFEISRKLATAVVDDDIVRPLPVQAASMPCGPAALRPSCHFKPGHWLRVDCMQGAT